MLNLDIRLFRYLYWKTRQILLRKNIIFTVCASLTLLNKKVNLVTIFVIRLKIPVSHMQWRQCDISIHIKLCLHGANSTHWNDAVDPFISQIKTLFVSDICRSEKADLPVWSRSVWFKVTWLTCRKRIDLVGSLDNLITSACVKHHKESEWVSTRGRVETGCWLVTRVNHYIKVMVICP